MKSPTNVKALEELGRVRLSQNFFLRDFLHSEVAEIYGIPNIPEDPDLVIEVGKRLCEELLEPLEAQFGRIAVRSGYRSCQVNELCNQKKHNCASNESNYAAHIWDRLDTEGNKGVTACIVIPSFADYLAEGGDWQEVAWYIHDTLPYSSLVLLRQARGIQHPLAGKSGQAHRQLPQTKRLPDQAGNVQSCRHSRRVLRGLTIHKRSTEWGAGKLSMIW